MFILDVLKKDLEKKELLTEISRSDTVKDYQFIDCYNRIIYAIKDPNFTQEQFKIQEEVVIELISESFNDLSDLTESYYKFSSFTKFFLCARNSIFFE